MRRWGAILPGRRRRWLLAVLPTALALYAWARGGEPRRESAKAQVQDLVFTAEVSGELRSRQSASLAPAQVPDTWEFKIAMIVPEGTEVRQGEPVIAFDTSELERRLEQAAAEADKAAAELARRAADLSVQEQEDTLRVAEAESRKRKAQLKSDVPADLMSRKELAQTRLELGLAEAETVSLSERAEGGQRAGQSEMAALSRSRDEARRKARELEEAIALMTVRAPRDGTVVHVPNWQGEKPEVGSAVWRGMRSVEIADLRAMDAAGEIDEVDLGRVQVGQPVRLRLDALPDRPLTGRIARGARAVERRSWRDPRRIVRILIELDQVDTESMRPGMRFRGEVELERLKDVLTIPLRAVRTTPAGPHVLRRFLGRWQERTVELGRHSRELVEVRGGLAAGDRVALSAPPSEENAQ